MNLKKASAEGTRQYYEGTAETWGDVRLHNRYFISHTDAGLAGGYENCVMFTIDRPANQVWALFKDFNKWQNGHGYYYTGAFGDCYSRLDGDLGTETVRISIRTPNDPPTEYPFPYVVLMVVPERLMVIFQPVPPDGINGKVSPGIHVFMLNEHEGKTTLSIFMQHCHPARVLYGYAQIQDLSETEEKTLEVVRKFGDEALQFWRDTFIPELKSLMPASK